MGGHVRLPLFSGAVKRGTLRAVDAGRYRPRRFRTWPDDRLNVLVRLNVSEMARLVNFSNRAITGGPLTLTVDRLRGQDDSHDGSPKAESLASSILPPNSARALVARANGGCRPIGGVGIVRLSLY